MSDPVTSFLHGLNKDKDTAAENVAGLLASYGIECEITRVRHKGKRIRAIAIVEPSFDRTQRLLLSALLGEINDSEREV